MRSRHVPTLLIAVAATLSFACGESYELLGSASLVRVGNADGTEAVSAVALGADGSAYLFGTNRSKSDGQAVLLGQAYEANRGGLYLAKLTPSGDVAWLTLMKPDDTTSIEDQLSCTGITLDGDGHLIVTGRITNALDLGDGLPSVPPWTDQDVATFVAKYTTDGAIVWSRRYWGVTRYGWPGAPQVDADGNIVFLAYEQFGVDFGNGPFSPVTEAFHTILVKLDANGELVFARGIGQPRDYVEHQFVVRAFALDAAGEIAFTALARGVIDLGDGFQVGAQGTWAELFARVGPTGEIVAARTIADTTDVGRATGMAVIGNGDFIIGGYHRNELSGSFLARLAPDGTRRWRIDTGREWRPQDLAHPLAADDLGSLAVDRQGRPIVLTTRGVTSYDLDGNQRWHYQFIGEYTPPLRRVAARGDQVVLYGVTGTRFEFAGNVLEIDRDALYDGYMIRFPSE